MRRNGLNRSLGVAAIAILLSLTFGGTVGEVMAASQPDIKMALVYPLSGALSRNGNLTVQGIKAAFNWVNDNGGIKSLGGAKLVPVVADSGSTVEGAASAMERVCRDPDITVAMGSWASSLTSASTEVSERLQIPHFSISYADSLNGRGFKWGFYVTTTTSGLTEEGLPKVLEMAKSAGQAVKTAMYIGDSTISAKTFYEKAKQVLESQGIKFIGKEGWSMGSLTDATPVMQKLRNLNPDIVLFHASAIAEAQVCLMKKKELGIKTPFVSYGGYAADPTFAPIGADALEGFIALTGSFPHKYTPKEWIDRSLEQCRKEYSNEPWVGQELGFAWTMVPIIAEILEQAGSRDRNKIREAASKLDIHDVQATKHTLKQGMAFDASGRLAKKYRDTLFVQWQGGTPIAVYPPNLAFGQLKWGAR